MINSGEFRSCFPTGKGIKTTMEGNSHGMTLEMTAKSRERKIPVVKVEPGKNNKVIIRTPYNQDLIRKEKSVPERKWNPEKKCWEVPYSEVLTSKLQNLFGENLLIDPLDSLNLTKGESK